MNHDDQTPNTDPLDLPIITTPDPPPKLIPQTNEYFIKFKGFKIGDKNRQPNPVQMLQLAPSAQQALAQLKAIYDIHEIVDIKKL